MAFFVLFKLAFIAQLDGEEIMTWLKFFGGIRFSLSFKKSSHQKTSSFHRPVFHQDDALRF